jgi:hypothetical protein
LLAFDQIVPLGDNYVVVVAKCKVAMPSSTVLKPPIERDINSDTVIDPQGEAREVWGEEGLPRGHLLWLSRGDALAQI